MSAAPSGPAAGRRAAGPAGDLARAGRGGVLAPAGQAAPPAPRWAQRAATLAVLTTLPSGLWRMGMATGIPVGVSDQIRQERYGFPGWGTVYVLGLTLLLVGLALLTLGLVQRWGEVVPRWIPLIGARRVPPLAAVVPAGTGAVALTLLWAGAMANVEQIWVAYGLDGAERALMVACYAPLLLWGPLLAAVTVSYHRRHRRLRPGRRATPGRGSRPGPPGRLSCGWCR